MSSSVPPPVDKEAPAERRNASTAPRLPFLFSAHFSQALFLCLLALAAVIVQIRGGAQLDAVLATGLGLLLGFLIYPRRLFILTALVLPLGIVNQLFDKGIISRRYIEPAHLLGLAFGLLIITWAMHRRPTWAHPGAISPGIVVAVLGLLLLAAVAPGSAGTYIFSFWLPAAVLGGLGLSYLVMSAFGRAKP